MTAHARMSLAEQAVMNLESALLFASTHGPHLRFPREAHVTLDGVLYALRQLAEDERERLEEFAKGNGVTEPLYQ